MRKVSGTINCIRRLSAALAAITLAAVLLPQSGLARDAEYEGGEIDVRVSPGEPTQLQFPGNIAGGFKKKLSALALDRKGSDLVIFANEGISDSGEAIIVRLDDSRSYSIRVRRASPDMPRDDIVRINDDRPGAAPSSSEEEETPVKDRQFQYASPTQVSGLMREMILAAEFGKKSIPGYRESEKYRGEVVLNDGTLVSTVEKIFIGANLWGYVLQTRNLLEQGQKLNPATFRLDGTRAVSAENWELAPKPLNVEQQISGKDSTRVYVITRAKKN